MKLPSRGERLPSIKMKLLSAFILSLLSASSYAYTNPDNFENHPDHIVSRGPSLTQPPGYYPARIKLAYGLDLIPQQGAGQTIAIIIAYDNPVVEQDLAVFNQQFNLPACTTANGCFRKIYADGVKPAENTGWGTEASLDVQWAHALAPQAKILLVEGANNQNAPLLRAIKVAIDQGANIISMSWSQREFSSQAQYDPSFNVPNVIFFGSSGNSSNGVFWPSVSPYVISTGGTRLVLTPTGYGSETAWTRGSGGISAYYTRPAYQANFANQNNPNNMRGVPDVSFDADPNTGVSVYDSFGNGGWIYMGGTSVAAPCWAGITAVIKSAATSALPEFHTALYQAATTSYATGYHDILSGSNGSCGAVCNAQPGYDYITGIGTPQANNLINLIIGGGGTCVRANQTMTISPSTTQTVTPGGSANYTVSVRNNDSANCAASNFNFVATTPSALTSSLSSSMIGIAPGATASTTLTVRSSTTTPVGTYTVPVRSTSASVSTNVATVNASLGVQAGSNCVRANPTITYSPNTTQTIQQNSSVTVNFEIKNNDSAPCSSSNVTATTSTSSSLIKSVLSNASFTIAPQGTATGFMIIKSSNVAVVGTAYSASMTANDTTNNRSASFTSNVVIGNPLH